MRAKESRIGGRTASSVKRQVAMVICDAVDARVNAAAKLLPSCEPIAPVITQLQLVFAMRGVLESRLRGEGYE